MSIGFELYDIQKDFIQNAIKCIEYRKTGIFSSPTGTGKTISLSLSLKSYLKKNKICDFSGINEKNIQMLKNFNFDRTPIFYASRTHSQLNQAIKELKNLNIDCDALVIGSRSLYCKHSDVNKYTDIEQVNEACRKLREKEKCIYFTNLSAPVNDQAIAMEQNQIEDEFNSILSKRFKKKEKPSFSLLNRSISTKKPSSFKDHGIHDIEELKNNDCDFCPYYKSKDLVKKASIIFLPYQMLFSKESRESFKLKIEDSIIIIDEAHNIYESVIQLNSATVSYEQIKMYLSAFRKYNSKFEDYSQEKENKKNLFFKKRIGIINTFIEILSLLYEFCKIQEGMIFKEENIIFVNDFLSKSGLDNYNMLLLRNHLRETNIIRVLEGYEKNLEFGLYTIVNFLILLTNSDKNGLILYDNKKIRFTPLDAKLYFEEINECRSLILAGGTMEPLDNILRIFPDADIFSYSSVCKDFTAHILSSSSSGANLKLTYEQRENKERMADLVITVRNLINSARSALNKKNRTGGIVCFVPSKNFLEQFKVIFQERSDLKINFHFEDLEKFKKDCLTQSSVLFAVMGGRLSEGINFQDDLCRLLLIIGIPYPSSTPELRQRIKFNGKNFLTNLAMKTVNQSLGMALRHKDDFASIVLIDQRYENFIDLLSSWIRKKIEKKSFQSIFKEIHEFIQKKSV